MWCKDECGCKDCVGVKNVEHKMRVLCPIPMSYMYGWLHRYIDKRVWCMGVCWISFVVRVAGCSNQLCFGSAWGVPLKSLLLWAVLGVYQHKLNKINGGLQECCQ